MQYLSSTEPERAFEKFQKTVGFLKASYTGFNILLGKVYEKQYGLFHVCLLLSLSSGRNAVLYFSLHTCMHLTFLRLNTLASLSSDPWTIIQK